MPFCPAGSERSWSRQQQLQLQIRGLSVSSRTSGAEVGQVVLMTVDARIERCGSIFHHGKGCKHFSGVPWV